MKREMGRNKRIIACALIFGVTAWSLQAEASGYKLEFQSAATLADSGDAAVVEDAGTNWYNSAGLVHLPQQLALSGIEIYQQTKFTGSVVAPNTLPTTPLPPGAFNTTGVTNSYPNAFLPAMHYVYPFKERWAVGLSVVPAWGLMEDYGNALLRYNLNRIYTKTIDVSPSVAMKINEQWSIGLGPDFHYFSVQSKNAVRTQVAGTAGDSLSKFSAGNWNEGWHAGVLFRVNDATRFGLNYRSKIVMHLRGYSDFGLYGVGLFETNQFKLNIPLPPTTSLSFYHDMTPEWAMMGTVAYDQWGVVKAYNAQNYQSINLVGSPVLIAASSPQYMQNTLDWGLGTHYQLNNQWMLRANVKYEPTPTKNAYRDVNFPDGNKLGVQIGARYQINKKLMLDLVYGHVFVQTAHISIQNPITATNTAGHVNTSMDLAGAQLVWNI
ncbi:MAG: fadL [Gammaproteobacteria bacterium]|jgi:long-chain fatty acid transport protein|nr:fadL [Gammaproteobacteria bacterium]